VQLAQAHFVHMFQPIKQPSLNDQVMDMENKFLLQKTTSYFTSFNITLIPLDPSSICDCPKQGDRVNYHNPVGIEKK